ncbi:MAG TPA: NUDIX domain-containing protein [Caulobacteraceae bacterium]|nr:NUDIX domain-containing protein [Caulobacteraceae bacterium]
MTVVDLAGLIASFETELAAREPIVDAEVLWPSARLRKRTFVGPFEFPSELLISARAVVFKGSRVVVVDEIHGERHIEPGGGIEPGEIIEQAARREIAEESGWSVGALKPLGFHYLEPLTPKPPGSIRRWGAIVHAIFVTEANSYSRAARDTTQIETGSRLTPIRRALADLRPDEVSLLRAAIVRRAQP